ncbi:13085_t:CDS:2, partial [Funneliformis geosporum]
IVNFSPDTNDIKGLSGTWLKRFMLEAKAKALSIKFLRNPPENDEEDNFGLDDPNNHHLFSNAQKATYFAKL